MLFSFIVQHERNAFLSHASEQCIYGRVFRYNKIGSYYVKFPRTFDLNGEWEVGLYSFTYFNTWYTLQNHQNHICYFLHGGKTFWSSAIVEYGYYTSMPELIESINAAMKMRTLQRCKPYNEHRDMLKPVEDDLNPPSVRPNAELKRERHLHL